MWFDAQAELAKLGGGRESDACVPATIATSATLRPRVANVAVVAKPSGATNEALQLHSQAIKSLETAAGVANSLLERLRDCETPAAVAEFFGAYQQSIDALERHATVRKIHIHNLADYKLALMKKGRI